MMFARNKKLKEISPQPKSKKTWRSSRPEVIAAKKTPSMGADCTLLWDVENALK